MKIIGIDTSCDDTSVAVVSADRMIMADRVASQKEHSVHGGVVPEIAHRGHLSCLYNLYHEVMQQAGLCIQDIAAVAVTGGPGLVGSLIIGLMFAKGLSVAAAKRLIIVNHLEAHLLSVRLSDMVSFPFLTVLVSGGHCQLILAKQVGDYITIGETLDDALGETYDKVARTLGLGYPGGPFIENRAKNGKKLYLLPRPMCDGKSCDFSFSGLKTATKKLICSFPKLSEQDINDICLSFQKCVLDVLNNKIDCALKQIFIDFNLEIRSIALVGGVASNQYLRNGLMQNRSQKIFSPPPRLCTDNGAMIAWAAAETLKNGFSDEGESISFEPKPNWDL